MAGASLPRRNTLIWQPPLYGNRPYMAAASSRRTTFLIWAGLKLSGFNISLDNCLISYTDWVGALTYAPLGVHGNQMRVCHEGPEHATSRLAETCGHARGRMPREARTRNLQISRDLWAASTEAGAYTVGSWW